MTNFVYKNTSIVSDPNVYRLAFNQILDHSADFFVVLVEPYEFKGFHASTTKYEEYKKMIGVF